MISTTLSSFEKVVLRVGFALFVSLLSTVKMKKACSLLATTRRRESTLRFQIRSLMNIAIRLSRYGFLTTSVLENLDVADSLYR